MTNNLNLKFKGPKHAGAFYMEWNEDGSLVYDYEGDAWPDAIRDVVEVVVDDISKNRKWRSDIVFDGNENVNF